MKKLIDYLYDKYGSGKYQDEIKKKQKQLSNLNSFLKDFGKKVRESHGVNVILDHEDSYHKEYTGDVFILGSRVRLLRPVFDESICYLSPESKHVMIDLPTIKNGVL